MAEEGRSARRLGRNLLAFLAALTTAAAPAFAQPAPEPSSAARAAWGFDRSDLVPHPGVRFGVLGNGMRYAIMRNSAPPGALSVRLHLAGGSNVEGERELGFMHLIEHMIFHGSANLPEGALPFMLGRQGLARLADFNAFTSHDETVYRLDLAKADGGARETAIALMREIAAHLVFPRRSVAGAKDAVRDEIRSRDALGDQIATAQNAFFVPGTPIARGPVAGTDASVGRADGAALRRLYQRFYVPGRATLICVGDFDPSAMEAEIVARFSDWRAAAATEPDRPPLVQSRSGAEARLFVDPAAATIVTIAAVRPLAAAGDAAGGRDSHYLEHLGSEMLGRRLARSAARPGAPFTAAGSVIYDHFSIARMAQVEVTARDRDWRRAIQLGEQELRRALDHGFAQAELDEQLAASHGGLVRDAARRSSPALADAIADAVGRRILFTEPGDPSATGAYLARVRLADVNAAFRAIWSDAGPLIFLSHHRRIPGAAAAILAAWTESRRVPVAPAAAK